MSDGGPAFPTAEDSRYEVRDGMSLRDYFAAQALAGLFGSKTFELGDHVDVQQAAHHAYRAADAMLKERSRAG